MSKLRTLTIGLALVMVATISGPLARADSWNQETRITFSEPMEIPGHVLPAGSYCFVLASDDADRSMVRIFSADKRLLYATVLTVPSHREEARRASSLTLAERPSGKPEAILVWFYEGEQTGHQFIYPVHERKEIAHDMRQLAATRAAGN